MNLNELETYRFNDKLLLKKIDTTVLVFNPENGDMYELDEIAGEIVEMLKDGKTPKCILHELIHEYDATEEQIYEDVAPLLDRFMELGIISEVIQSK